MSVSAAPCHPSTPPPRAHPSPSPRQCEAPSSDRPVLRRQRRFHKHLFRPVLQDECAWAQCLAGRVDEDHCCARQKNNNSDTMSDVMANNNSDTMSGVMANNNSDTE